MKGLQAYIHKVMEDRSLSLTALTQALGYKSKTSLERLMTANSRESSLRKFERAMLAAFPLTQEERSELSEVVETAIFGRKQLMVERQLWDFIQGKPSLSDEQLEIVQADKAEHVSLLKRYSEVRNLRITVLNCQYVPELFLQLRVLLERGDVRVNHYIYVNDNHLRTVSAMNALKTIFFDKGYNGYTYNGADTESCGMNEADLMAAEYEDAAGQPFTDLVVFHSASSGRLLRLPGRGLAFDALLGLDERQYSVIKQTYCECTAFEDYIQYSRDCAAIERNSAVWMIKPDMCMEQIPVNVMEAALLRGTASVRKDAAFFDTLRTLREIYQRRVEHTYSKKKHAYTIMKRSALRRFAATGRTQDHFWMMAPYTVEERIAILRELLVQQINNPYVHLYFLKDDDAIRDMGIAYYENSGMLLMQADTDYNLKNGHTEVMITHQEMLRLYREFYMNRLIKEYVLSDSETCKFLKRLIADLERANGVLQPVHRASCD